MASFSSLLVFLFAAFFVRFADSACTQHDIRLRNGPNAREGRIEYCYNNQWGTVCDDLFGTNDAKVVCSQLNYDANDAVAFTNAAYGAGSGPIVLDNLRCSGNEINLRACPRNGFNNHNCNHNEDAGVRCPPCIDGSVWLPGGTTWREGTVEVCYNGLWSTVCDDQWGTNDAKVICKMLDYDTNGATQFTQAYFGQRYGPIIFDNVQCSGSESSIFNCNSNPLGNHNCGHNEDAGVRCPACVKGSIRLWSAYNNTPPSEGMLHYCHNSGEWKAMCKYQWGCQDAKVACRNLGYNGSLSINALYDVEGAYGYYKPVLPQRVTCTGAEPVLKSCSFQYTTWCDSPVSETAGVRCMEAVVGHGCTAGDLRLQNGNAPGEGRPEFCFHDEWSPFCQMDDEEAMVACKQLGYTAYPWASIFTDERFGSSGYVSDFQSIACSTTASENHMINCTINYSPGCSVYGCWRERGIKCFNNNPAMCKEGAIRLVDGDIEQEGRIEFCYKGVWSTICGHYWGQIDSYTVCRLLNYTAPRAPTTFWGSYFGDGIYPIVWDFVACGGWEKTILDCSRKEYLQFTCGRGGIMSARCYDDCNNGDIRLVGGSDPSEGTVEVCNDNLWGLIDGAGWSDPDATVVCRQLGFSVDAATSLYAAEFGRPNKTIHYTNVFCTGAEDILSECTFTIVSVNDGKTLYKNHTGVGVDCSPSPPTPPPCVDFNSIGFTYPATPLCTDNDVRLMGGNSSAGRLEVCFNGTWTPLCSLDPAVASIMCQDLGFTQYTWAAISNDGLYGTLTNYSFISNITCVSSASTLSACTLSTSDCIPNCPLANIWLRCFNPGECTGDDIRLVDGYVANEGRVELCVNGVWGSVCGSGWDATDAHIACIQLGHPELKPVVFHNSFFGSGSRPIVYSNMGCVGFENTTTLCSKQVYPSFSCSRNNVAGVLCGADCTNGQVRLMGGADNTQGSVEICFDNVWGNLIESGWGDKDASLVCQLLGFLSDGAIPYYGSYYGKTAATALVSDLYCTGDEVDLLECTMTRHSVVDGKSLLANSHVAGVQCMTPNTCVPPPTDTPGIQCTTGKVQITGGADTGDQGNLYYCYNGNWSPFCTLDRNTATVACRQLGFTSFSWSAIIDDGRYLPPSNTSSFQNITCQGGETLISSCVLYDDCMSSCPIPYGIRCYEPQAGSCVDGMVRLAGGSIAQEGRVEICSGGVWSGVCADSNWDKADALVVCNQLGLGISEPYIYSDSSVYGEPFGPIVYANLGCKGYETSLSQCSMDVYPSLQCSRSQIAGVLCRDICTEGDIKLMGGTSPNEGTVVICRNSLWGVIAQQSWDVNDAIVTCRQLNYTNSGAMARINSYYGKPNLTVATSSVVCSGTESRLSDCSVNWLSLQDGKSAAAHVDVAGVYCTPNTPPPGCQLPPDYRFPVCTTGTVQLIGGSASEGLLQYCYNGQWSGFCTVDAKTALVACKQLGYTQYSWASLITNGQYGSGMGYSLFDNLTCTGTEGALSQCTITQPGQCLTKCTPGAAIKCYSPGICNEGTIRLADGVFDQQGRVEICTNGIWGTICDQGWDDADARILCRDLGYTGTASKAYGGSRFGIGTGPVIYSNVQCGGAESTFTDCQKDTYPSFYCTTDQVASVLCTYSCTDGDIKLVGGSTMYEGTVEICYGGIWGMVGSLNWGSADARVVCYQLGFGLTGSVALPNSPYGRPNDTVLLTNLGCGGAERKLGDCSATQLDVNTAQQYSTVAGVRCLTDRSSVILRPTSTVSSSSSTNMTSPTSAPVSIDETASITAAAAILGVVTFFLIIIAIGIAIGMIYIQFKRREASRALSKKQLEERRSTGPREVVNPLATETGLDDENDEDTKKLHQLIKESQLQ